SSLLARLRDPRDGDAWQEFVELCGSLVYSFVRQRGLQDADAADLTQEVFLAVAGAVRNWHYDPAQGTFRGWLYGITRNKLARFLRRRYAQPVARGGSNAQHRLEEQSAPQHDLSEDWEREFQQQLFRVAAAKVQGSFTPSTWQAFWLTAVEGQSPTQTAKDLGLSVGAVYIAKSRVLARLVEQIQLLQSE